ncbi:hypothetical protein LRS74_13140 [Streptomyces sp. LX-29]|uniref:hypothetical protein n=1 Tax=Streptomyces sp. LX-29 TaxID=2900152 RepID=UPI00240D0EBD|nr:hypothetical protein [Streptomyces sp. LX-29]WFB07888.1 hypothetical protein LRS74_13140 [Streptomyces sp. LX-29]
MKRVLAGFVGTAALVGGMLTLASPAQANTNDCEGFLRNHGYVVKSKVRLACKKGEPGGGIPKMLCRIDLKDLGVKERHAELACDLASA